MEGKKVGDFLTDLKLPAEERRRLLVVADPAGPVWLVGLRISDGARITRRTRRVLRLSAEWDGARTSEGQI